MTEAPTAPSYLPVPRSLNQAAEQDYEPVHKLFTTIVIDSDVMLYDVKVFDYLVSRRYTVAVSTNGWTKLNQLSRNSEDQTSRAATKALIKIKTAVQGPNEVRLLDQDAKDVTPQAIQTLQTAPPVNTKDEEDCGLVSLTRRASDLPHHHNTKPQATEGQPKAAALLTNDTSVLSKAKEAGIYVIAYEKIKEWMNRGRGVRSPSEASAGSNGQALNYEIAT